MREGVGDRLQPVSDTAHRSPDTYRLCSRNDDPVTTVHARTLGECWLRTSAAILEHGDDAAYDGMPIKEIAQMALSVAEPDPDDPTIAELGDPAWSAWMHENFFTPVNVPELGGARSYASRLFDYGGSGSDQLAWVVDRLRADPASRSATITTFEPLHGHDLHPLRQHARLLGAGGPPRARRLRPQPRLRQEGYGNLVELARLQELVAGELELPLGSLTLYVKSAHVYEPEWALMGRLVESVASPARG